MKYYIKFLTITILKILLLFNNNIFAQTNCDDPLGLDWLQFSLGDPCVEGIYTFEYNESPYVYVVSKPECIAADARNTLYNCTDESFCYYFGFTLPSDQCDQNLIDAITPLLTGENLIYPLSISRTCENPLQLTWVQESLNSPCTDGIYAFEYGGASYVYRSTACEYVDDPNRLYNCDNKNSCFVDGKTLPQDQCDLTEFPLRDLLIPENLIWSSPLLRLIPEYPWLTSKINLKQCDDVEIKEYKTSNAGYLSIKNNNTVELYAENGSLLCTNANNFNCEEAYGLSSPSEEWACNMRIDPPVICGIDEPQDSLPWLQEIIDNVNCNCNTTIIQYCYYGEVYFDSTPISPICADYPGFIIDVEGNVICQNGGITGGDCHEIIPDFIEVAEKISTVWSCEDQSTGCETLQFTSLNAGCDCCSGIILFEIEGGDGNYEVTTLYGQVVTSGMGLGLFSIGANELIVTDGQGCTATGIFNNFPFCCEVPPVCEAINISYSCVNGLQITGFGDCNSIPVIDQNGNTFYQGDFLEDGSYAFSEANQGQVSPPCTVNEVTVSCSEDLVCNMPPDSGPCEAYIPRYYYNPEAQECMQFIYGGCEGNENNYESYEVCTNACGYNYVCPYFETPLQLPWLQKIIENANGCSVKEVSIFTYNNNFYFKTTPSWGGGFCPSDMPTHYYNCDGLRLCSQGFTPFPTCNAQMVAASNATGQVIWTYSENNCNNLQFDFVTVECDACCDETLSFAISGGDGNYNVSTSEGVPVYNGMPFNTPYLSGSFTLVVTDGQSCTAEQYYMHDYWCCEVPPLCQASGVIYDCAAGLQIMGEGECNFTDEEGNSYEAGSSLANGTYTLTSIYAQCDSFEVTVNCEDIEDYCDFEDVEITSDPVICGENIITLTTNDVFGNEGPDDYEIVFVKVFDDNTFEILDDPSIYEAFYCFYAIAYRWSCGAPDFDTNNFNDILNNAGDYKVSACFTVNYIQAPEYSVTTEPYCVGEGLFTVGVTINGGSGSYIVGQDYTGETIYGGAGENFITFASGEEFYDIYPTDAETGCANDYIIPVIDPGCENCGCDTDYTPVCGVDGNTYSNACVAECEGIEIDYEGECEVTCECPGVYEPVCGIDGVTYANACLAECEAVEVVSEGECVETGLNCSDDDPLQWAWMQNLIVEYGGCEISQILQFSYNSTPHFTTRPGYPPNLTCPSDAPYNYYNCEGELICQIGFFPPDSPNFCNTNIQLASHNATVIWTYNETNCAHPFELELVQQAIENEECTQGIYAFDFEGESFVYVQGLCGRFIDGPSDVLYNCNTGLSCYFSYELAFGDACNELFNEVNYLINEENLIWSPDEECECPADYDPVCGVDGITYSNECTAACEGVEVAYEGECRVELNCLLGDPLHWIWMQNLVIEYGGCEVAEIQEFTYQGTPHFVTRPGYPPNLTCATDAPSNYYNCEGDLICQVGFFPPDDPNFCNSEIISAANNGTVIWTYNETNCTDPFELELVQSAIENETCTGGIYAFDFEGESFIYIQTLCEFIDAPNVLHNCNTGLSCAIGGETIYIEACYKRFDQVSYLINDDNLIWTKPCEYETRAIVSSYDCGLVLEAPDDLILEPAIVPDGFTLKDGQTVEFTYRRIPIGSTCSFAQKAEIICIREVEELCPCDDVYKPVCGEDGITYANACEAACAGVEIAYEGECNINPKMFDKFSWLNNFIFFNGFCENGTIVTEYIWSNSFSFVYIQLPNGEGKLYYQDGTYYCTDAAGYSCLDLYGLTNLADSWTCNQPPNPNDEIVLSYGALNCNDDGTFIIDLSATGASSKSYGVYHSYGVEQPDFIFFNEDETISFEGNVSDAEDGLFTAYIYDQYLADVAAKIFTIDVSDCIISPPVSDKVLFNRYTWLGDLVDPDDCTPGYEITEFDFGSYSFIHIQANNEGSLYLGDGTYYCTDAEGFSCVEVYGFTNPTATSSCSNIIDCADVFEPICGVDGNTYDNACFAERAGVAVAYEGACTNVELFSQYPWLTTLINPGECDESSRVNEFDFGSYSFIFIEDGSFGSLYYQDGTYYCTDGPGYSCVGLYGFSEAAAVWSCDGNLIRKEQHTTTNHFNFDEAFKVYPNPSKGKLKVEFLEPAQSLSIMNMDGRLLQTLPIDNNETLMELNLTDIAKGIYLLQLQTGDKIKTQKMIIH